MINKILIQMNKKINIILLALVFGLIGSTIAYFLHLNKFNKIQTEIKLEFHFLGGKYPKIIEDDFYDKIHLIELFAEFSRVMDDEVNRLFLEHKESNKYSYIRTNTNPLAYRFSIIGLDHEKDKETLLKLKNQIINETKNILLKNLIENKNSFNNKIENCKLLKQNNYERYYFKRMNISEKSVKNFFNYLGLLGDDYLLGPSDVRLAKKIRNDYENILKDIKILNRNYLKEIIPCQLAERQVKSGNLILEEFDKLTGYETSYQKKYLAKDLTFILFRAFVNGILFFIFLRLSILYFIK